MAYINRIEAVTLNPLLIDIHYGLQQYLNFSASVNGSVSLSESKELYKRALEDAKPSLYLVDGESLSVLSNVDGDATMTEKKSIIQINMKGTMLAEGGFCTPGIDYTCQQIEKAADNPNIIGIVINTHSGGGEVTAAQRAANSIQYARKMKPVIQFVDGMAASGAYYAGVCADEIVLNSRVASVGSIGVVIQMNKEDIEYLNENLIRIFSDGSDGIPGKQDIFTALLNGDYDFVKKKQLNPIRKEFIKIVKDHRTVNDEVFSGTMFMGTQAKNMGLVDHIGNRQMAINRVLTLYKRRGRKASAASALANVN
jgi:ClpP class serine protease